jgi:hypothetical protein
VSLLVSISVQSLLLVYFCVLTCRHLCTIISACLSSGPYSLPSLYNPFFFFIFVSLLVSIFVQSLLLLTILNSTYFHLCTITASWIVQRWRQVRTQKYTSNNDCTEMETSKDTKRYK